VRVSVLGPLRLENESGEVVLGAAKERSLLAALALSPGRVVGIETLVSALWGETPPATSRKTLQTYVSNLRRVIGADAVETVGSGYVLRVAVDDVDVGRFRTLVGEGEHALKNDSVEKAREKLAQALTLWRGEPFADVEQHTGVAAEAVRLREEYLSALESRLTADLAAGRHRELVGELEMLVREHPFREQLWGDLVVALYRSGRQADALAAYQRARDLLRDELGLEPGGALRRLERAVLVQDPSLDAPAPGLPSAAGTQSVFRSPVRYAVSSDGVHVAYQVIGDGPIDVIAVPGFVSHLDMWWDAPTDRLVQELASFSRLILFDKRGMGLSDRPSRIDIEQWVEDTQAVLDAVGSEQAVVVGISAGGPTAALFAATRPERTRALVLYGAHARVFAGDGYEFGFEPATVDAFIRNMEANWGTGVGISLLAPSRAADPVAREFWARCQTTSASPTAAATFLRALTEIDVRHALPLIDAPTLILHASRDRSVPVEAARHNQQLIPNAKLVELDTDVHLIWVSDVIEQITSEIERFIAQTVPTTNPERMLTTLVAFAPSDLLPSRSRAVDAAIERNRGRVLHPRGIVLFDGPARAIRCAQALMADKRTKRSAGVAVHTGECQFADEEARGIAVDLVKQLAALAVPGQVLVTQTVRDLTVGSSIELESHSQRSFDGIPGEWEIFEVAS
jgi:DNA-binding SARP family transcriptional activator/pimeloyl-ACP methyl ester carboxylesterase